MLSLPAAWTGYRDTLAGRAAALAGPDNTGDPPDVALIGDLRNMRSTAGLTPKTKQDETHTDNVLSRLQSSVNAAPGARRSPAFA